MYQFIKQFHYMNENNKFGIQTNLFENKLLRQLSDILRS